MAVLKIKYVQTVHDRYGNAHYYFRRRGYPRVALPGLPGTTEFMDAYQHALGNAPRDIGAGLNAPGTFTALAVAYYQSAEWRQLEPITQNTYRNIIEKFRERHGGKPVRKMEPRHVRALIAERAETPAAANALLKMLRILMRYAVEHDWIKADPTRDVRRIRSKSDGFHTWTESEIARFEEFWPLGSKARLALALLLYTGQRPGDVRQMGWYQIHDGVLELRQSKTGTHLSIPVHAELARALDLVPRLQQTFLVTGEGKPFSAGGFGNWFRDRRREAGLPEKISAHGLRKASARRLAEAGCTAHQIKAVGGWSTLKEVERYTRAANQVDLARTAIASIAVGNKVEEKEEV
ncbi:site-specific integrase [Komagataeibacter saccharivorans]|uniref:site-specific integrase n=1 Tax=Komagataeibacter saccharivorans TaxID=265959 RepID=UPI0039E884A0